MAMHVRVNVPPIPEAIEALAEGLVRLNMVLMGYADERGVETPPLYASGIRYRRETPGQEWWESAADLLGVMADRTGDCEDLAAYRAAELRYFDGELARVRVYLNRRNKFHAVVERESGEIEDPSRIAIMLEREHNKGAR